MTTKAPARAIAVIAALTALVVVPASLAGKGGNGGGPASSDPPSLSLVMVNDVNGNGSPNYGDAVTFNVSTTATDSPYVYLTCAQGGTTVYNSSYLIGFYADFPWPWLRTITLSSQTWTGGAASCTATLVFFSGRKLETLSTLNFEVGA